MGKDGVRILHPIIYVNQFWWFKDHMRTWGWRACVRLEFPFLCGSRYTGPWDLGRSGEQRWSRNLRFCSHIHCWPAGPLRHTGQCPGPFPWPSRFWDSRRWVLTSGWWAPPQLLQDTPIKVRANNPTDRVGCSLFLCSPFHTCCGLNYEPQMQMLKPHPNMTGFGDKTLR